MLRIGSPSLPPRQGQFDTCPHCAGRLTRVESFLNTRVEQAGSHIQVCRLPEAHLGRLMDESLRRKLILPPDLESTEELRQMVREDIEEQRKIVQKLRRKLN